jgi:hypothetical protein
MQLDKRVFPITAEEFMAIWRGNYRGSGLYRKYYSNHSGQDFVEFVDCEVSGIIVVKAEPDLPPLLLARCSINDIHLEKCRIDSIRIVSTQIKKILIDNSNIKKLETNGCTFEFNDFAALNAEEVHFYNTTIEDFINIDTCHIKSFSLEKSKEVTNVSISGKSVIDRLIIQILKDKEFKCFQFCDRIGRING